MVLFSDKQLKSPESYNASRKGYYERLLQEIAGNTCCHQKPHRIVTRSRVGRNSYIHFLGKTVCTICGREF